MSYRSQAVASSVLGTALSLVLAALYTQYGPGEPATCFVVAVFLLVPLWCGLLMWGLKQQVPRRAWIGLGVPLVFALVILLWVSPVAAWGAKA